MKPSYAIALAAAAATGLMTVPARADSVADAVYAELVSVDPAFTARADFSSHINYSDDGGLTFYEVRALWHHLGDDQREALAHICDHIQATPRLFLDATHEFCEAFDDADE